MPVPFGTYQLLEKIAQGGMAEVFLARKEGEIGGFTRRLAIKRMFPHLIEQKEIITMFIDEARIASRLNHPNIVQIYDLGIVDETFFIAMEYVEGLDLRRLCELGVNRNHFIPLPLAVHICAEVAAGLQYAHTRTDEADRPMNIVHRDISPQNILISVDGGVKICDFGIAKAESRLTHTRTGEFKGKFAYMSPEQFGSGPLDHRSDIFTLGTLLYEITVVTRLFRARTEYETIRKITEGDVAPPSSMRPDYPPELERIVLKALSVDPLDRYQSAGDFHEDLEEWLFNERARIGARQLAAYLDEVVGVEGLGGGEKDFVIGGEAGPEAAAVSESLPMPEPEAVPQIAADGGGDDDSTLVNSIPVRRIAADAISATKGGKKSVDDDSTLDDSTYSFPELNSQLQGLDEAEDRTAQLQISVDSVEVRRISPEEAERRRQGDEPPAHDTEVEGDATLVDQRFPSGILPSSEAPSQEITGEWGHGDKGRVEAGEGQNIQTANTAGLAVDDRPDAGVPTADASGSFLKAIPDLKPGGRSLTGLSAVRDQRQRLTAPMDRVPEKPTGPTRRSLPPAGIIIGGGVVVALFLGLLVILLMNDHTPEVSTDEVEVEEAVVLERGPETVGDRMVTLDLRTEPAEAYVVANGVLVPGQTPLQVDLVDGRDNEVWIARRHHRPQRLLIPAEGNSLERTVELERASPTESARVDFRSEPSGAQVFINGEAIGLTPLRMENVNADFETHLQFELDGHRPFVAFVDLRSEADNRIDAVLAPEDQQSVDGRFDLFPSGSRVSIGGEFASTTPFARTFHRDEWLSVEVEGYQRQPRRYRLRLDRIGAFEISTTLDEEARPTGRVSIEVEPTAAIYIDSRAYGAGPLEGVELPVGDQTVVFETMEGRRLRASLDVSAESHRRYRVEIDGDDARVEEIDGR